MKCSDKFPWWILPAMVMVYVLSNAYHKNEILKLKGDIVKLEIECGCKK